MKKTTFKKAISMLLTFSLLFSIAVVFNVSASEQTSAKTVEIVSNNVYYGDTLKLMYAVKAENITSGDSVALKLYDKNGGELETITNYETQAVNGESCYVFTSAYGVPAHKIDTEVYAKAIILNGAETVAESDMLKYSVLEYLYERLTVSKEKGKVSAEQEAMYEGLIEYACLAEKVLTNKSEADKIANYSYVYNANASGAEKGAIYKKGSTINGFSHNITNPEYTVIWQIDKYDKSGNFIDSEVLTDAALASSGYTVGEYNVVISARENAITEADVLSQISTFGNPSNFNVDGSTYGSRGCVRFSFPIKAGTTFRLKEEYRTKYKIAIFCDSEFFHGKDWDELKERLKKSNNSEFWLKKIQSNIDRDDKVDKELRFLGWTVIRFWGKDIKKNPEGCIQTIEEKIFDLTLEKTEQILCDGDID